MFAIRRAAARRRRNTSKGHAMIWYIVNEYGCAVPVPDTPAISAAIDSGALRNVYGSIEGAIKHGGVLATAFKRKTNETYDAMRWLTTGELVPMGSVTITTVTAEPTLGLERSAAKCKFCGTPRSDLDEFGYCGPCNRGMAATNGD
jgi:hypothetical protein